MADFDYRLSENVSVFPSTYRKAYPSGKFTSETNFANIIKSIVSRDSYVVSYDKAAGILKLVVYGYYFVVEKMYDLLTTTGPTWAGIQVESDINAKGVNLVQFENIASTELDGNDGRFLGLAFGTGSPPNDSATGAGKHFCILRDSNSVLDVRGLNYKRLSSNAIYWDYAKNGIPEDDITLTEKINSKQDNMIAKVPNLDTEPGLRIGDENNTKCIYIVSEWRARLRSLKNADANHDNKPQLIYFNGDDGTLKNVTSNVGSPWQNIGEYQGQTLFSTGLTYLGGGEVKQGINIYYSKAEPDEHPGNGGDIWIKFQ